jgi:hypothetical protein
MNKGVKQFLEEAAAYVRSCGGQAAAAKKLKMSTQYLCDIIMGRRPISEKFAAKLGYEWVLQKRDPK